MHRYLLAPLLLLAACAPSPGDSRSNTDPIRGNFDENASFVAQLCFGTCRTGT